MPPAEIARLIADLVRAGTDAELVGRVAAAIVTDSVTASHASPGVTGAAPRVRSAGAVRTARWRARKRVGLVPGLPLAEVTGVTSRVTPAIRQNGVPDGGTIVHLRAYQGGGQDFRTVTPRDAVTVVASPGDDRGKSDFSPRTPLKKINPQSPPDAAAASPRDGVTPARRRYVRRAEKPATPPLAALVDRSQPDRRGRLWVDAADPVYRDLEAHSPTRSLPGGGDGWWFAPQLVAAARERLGKAVTALPVGIGPPAQAARQVAGNT